MIYHYEILPSLFSHLSAILRRHYLRRLSNGTCESNETTPLCLLFCLIQPGWFLLFNNLGGAASESLKLPCLRCFWFPLPHYSSQPCSAVKTSHAVPPVITWLKNQIKTSRGSDVYFILRLAIRRGELWGREGTRGFLPIFCRVKTWLIIFFFWRSSRRWPEESIPLPIVYSSPVKDLRH